MNYKHEQLSNDLSVKLKLHLKRNTLENSCGKVGTSKATLYRVLNGGMPELMTYAKICKFLNKPMNTYVR
jgi:DNA-binding phage protein